MVQLVSRHSCVADRLPVVVRFPASPRVRLKTVDPMGNRLGPKKNYSLLLSFSPSLLLSFPLLSSGRTSTSARSPKHVHKRKQECDMRSCQHADWGVPRHRVNSRFVREPPFCVGTFFFSVQRLHGFRQVVQHVSEHVAIGVN